MSSQLKGHECNVSDDVCEECCEHQFDMDEGYMCLECGAQGDIGALIDSLEYTFEER